jgi:purine-binding chemotaxis protein CheW
VNLGSAPSSEARVRAEERASVHHRFMTFFLNDRAYGLALRHVAEITPLRSLNKLPHMPRAVEGILDLRGRVVPVVNLRVRMAMPPLDPSKTGTILVLDLAGTATGLLVDSVDAVVTIPEEDIIPASPLLAGLDGAWVEGFIIQGERVITLLDAALIASHGIRRTNSKEVLAGLSLEERLDEGLKRLIELAPTKQESEHRVVPQIETSISYTEQEMSKVMERVEAMLSSTDKVFTGIGYLKQEAGLGKLKGHEEDIAELERTNQEMQDAVFALIQQMQFQDIARQKLERVMIHLQGMQGAISGKLRAAK